MGLFDILFGSKPKTSIRTLSTLDPTQQGLESSLASELNQPINPADFDIGLSDLENVSLAALEQNALERVTGKNALHTKAAEALIEQLTAGPQDVDELINAVTNESKRTFERDVLPNIDRKFANDFYSSDRRNAELRATDDFGSSLAQTIAELRYGAVKDQNQRKLSALGLVSEVSAAPMNEMLALLEAGGRSTALKERNLDRKMSAKKDRTAQILQLLGTPTLENVVINKPGSQGIIGPLLGAAAKAFIPV